MPNARPSPTRRLSRSPYGERGLKFPSAPSRGNRKGRSPYGERGLKLTHSDTQHTQETSLSLRRAWIEIRARHEVAVEISRSPYGERGLKSWIGGWVKRVAAVALLTESVD